MTSYDQHRANFILPTDRGNYPQDPNLSAEFSSNEGMKSPLFATPPSASASQTNYGSTSQPQGGEANWPPCKPMIRHSIDIDIEQEYRMFIRQAYIGWYFHTFAIIYNFICMAGNLIVRQTIIGFVMALIYFFLSPCCAFFPYYTVYNAVKGHSSFRYTMWFCLHGSLILFEIVLSLGFETTGGAGLILSFTLLTSKEHTLGVMVLICFFAWLITILFNIWVLYRGKAVYAEIGGSTASLTKEVTTGVATAAYENRETIGQVVRDNQDTIKQVALEHKDEIYRFAVDNRETIGQVAAENKDTIIKTAYDNRDVLKQNSDVINNVFSGNREDENPFG